MVDVYIRSLYSKLKTQTFNKIVEYSYIKYNSHISNNDYGHVPEVMFNALRLGVPKPWSADSTGLQNVWGRVVPPPYAFMPYQKSEMP